MSTDPTLSSAPQRPTAGPVELSIVVPAFNEEQRLPATLDRLRAYLATKSWIWEILVADDGSADATPRLVAESAAHEPAIRLLRYTPNRGKGYAVRQGMQAALGERRLLCDADLSTPIEEIEKLWARLDDGADIAIGSRALRESNLAVHQPFLREMVGRSFNLVVRCLAVPGIADTQCGFKLFQRKAATDLFPDLAIDRWCFDVEMLLVAQRRGYRIDEVPVTWINSPSTKVNVLRDLCRTIVDLVRIRWIWRRDPRRLGRAVPAEGSAAEALPHQGP